MKCEVCGKELQQITSSHLKKHGITVSEYKIKYTQAEILNRNSRDKLSIKCKLQNQNENFGFKDGHKTNEGKKPWNKNKTKSDDSRIKGYARIIGQEQKNYMSKLMKQKHRLGLIDVSGENNGMYGKKLSEAHKKALWGGWKRRMTRPEEKAWKVLIQYGFKYTGNGKLWLKFENGKRKNPDFISKQHNLIVEVFGNYWHNSLEVPYIHEQYNKIGYKCLILWENEIDDFSPEALERYLGIWDYEDFTIDDFNGGWIYG